jgi:16S rRNA G966 N2-methylase RsmD
MSHITHIDHALVAKAHTPEYLMHKYWARKPHNVVAEYIKHYSKEGEIILDPFAGSGVTATEAIKLGRKGIAIDLNPIATFIAKSTIVPIDTGKIVKIYKIIESKLEKLVKDLYETRCPKCKIESVIICTHWNGNNPIKIMFDCKRCGKDEKSISSWDLEKIERTKKKSFTFWFPTDKLAYNHLEFRESPHIPEINSVDKLFTKRNLLVLSAIWSEIEKIKETNLKDIMRFAFTSMSHLASKMTPVRPTRLYSSCWVQHRYWIPPQYMESNVWMLFDSAVNGRQGIIKGKEYSNNIIKHHKEAQTFNDFEKDANILIKTHNALELEDILAPNSVDYVFTDPPYGGAIQYLELSTLWASWLKMGLDFKDEITINDSQKKDFDYYHKMLTASFKQIYRVLKPEKYMTVTFHSTDIRVWNSIIQAVILAGFELEKIIYQAPARASAKGLLQPYGSAVGDYYIRFKKPKTPTITPTGRDEVKYERIVVESTKKIIAKRGEPCPYTHILNGIVPALREAGALLSGSKSIEKILKNHVGKEFKIEDIRDETGKVVGKMWWFKNPEEIPYLERVPLHERVERAVIETLQDKIKITFDDLLQQIFIKFPNALTPEAKGIKEILKEYAETVPGGKWRLRPRFKEREGEHSKIIYYLVCLGKKSGFKVWIGLKEQGSKFKNEPLSKLCDERDLNLPTIPTTKLERVKNIDVLWYKDDRVVSLFEVENTTGVTEAIVRGANVPYQVERFIVIPEERARLLDKRLKEPVLAERVNKDKWQRIYYSNLEDFYTSTLRKKIIRLEEFKEISEREAKIDKKGHVIQNLLF